MQRNSIFVSQSPLTIQVLIQTELYITVHTATFQWMWYRIYMYKPHPRLLSAVLVSHSQTTFQPPTNYCVLIEKQWENRTNMKCVVLHTNWVNKLQYPFPRHTAIQHIPVPFQQHFLLTLTAKILNRRWRRNERMCRENWRNHAGVLVESYRQGNTEVLIKTPSLSPLRPPQKLQIGLGKVGN
jgi:hypothetical protein